MNRREFVGAALRAGISGAMYPNLIQLSKAIGKYGLVSGGIGAALSGCSGVKQYEIPNTEKYYEYPELSASKIQAPKQGCMIGFHSVDFHDRGGRGGYSYLKSKVGIGPKILVPPWDEMMSTYTKFAHGRRLNVPENMLMHDKAYHQFFGNLETVLEFVPLDQLESDKPFIRNFTEYGKNIAKLRRPMFFTVMQEQNGIWDSWGQQAKAFKKAWRLLHKIFDDVGANEYSTWFWETYMHLGRGSHTNPPNLYYPGDNFVDWIGISVHKQAQYPNHNRPFSEIAGYSIGSLHRAHPDKPLIISEMGATQNRQQASWFTNAFNTIRRRPEIKAVTIFDNRNPAAQYMHLLNEESWAALREVFKDPYFIGFRDNT